MAVDGGRTKAWQFSRQINLAVLIQLFLVAVLVMGSWVDLQRQLALLQHDIGMLLSSYERIERQLEELAAASAGHEYRIRAIEHTQAEKVAVDESS